jgi:hypothetical protein
MKIKEVSFGRTKNTGNYNSLRAEVRIEIDEDAGESYADGLAKAKMLVDYALGEGPSAEEVKQAQEVLSRASAFGSALLKA